MILMAEEETYQPGLAYPYRVCSSENHTFFKFCKIGFKVKQLYKPKILCKMHFNEPQMEKTITSLYPNSMFTRMKSKVRTTVINLDTFSQSFLMELTN